MSTYGGFRSRRAMDVGGRSIAPSRYSQAPSRASTRLGPIPEPARTARTDALPVLAHDLASMNVTDDFLRPLKVPARELTAESFKIGEIIRVPHPVPSLDPNDKNSVQTIAGDLCVKLRYAIVIGISSTRMHVLPMYSCNEQGIALKSDEYKLSSFLIRHRDDISLIPEHMRTKETLLTQNSRMWLSGSHVNVFDVLAVNYDWPIEQGHGLLAERSRNRIDQRVQLAQYVMRKDLSSQLEIYERKAREAIRKEKEAMELTSAPPPTQFTGGRSTFSWASHVASKAGSTIPSSLQAYEPNNPRIL